MALGVHGTWVYVGEIAAGPTQLGNVYRFQVAPTPSPKKPSRGFTG